jgi:hypothetical protein
MKKILIVSFLSLSFSAFGEDWNPWSSTKNNSDDLIIKSIIVNSSNIGAARIFKEDEEINILDDKKCILWFDGTKFCVFK